jgi:hypothetical protein
MEAAIEGEITTDEAASLDISVRLWQEILIRVSSRHELFAVGLSVW